MSMRRGVGEYEGNGNKRGVAEEERGNDMYDKNTTYTNCATIRLTK